MTYDDVSRQAEQLSYRDKLRLAQLLIQLARKEEEEQNPEKRKTASASTPSATEVMLSFFAILRLWSRITRAEFCFTAFMTKG